MFNLLTKIANGVNFIDFNILCICSLRFLAQNDNLPIHEEKNKGVYVKGLLEVYVSSIQEVYEVMKRGGAARIVAYTSMLLISYILFILWQSK